MESYSSRRSNRMVCPDGCNPKKQWKSSSMRRSHKAQSVCVTRKPSPTNNRHDICTDNLASARYFSRLDVNSGFWQIKLSKRSKPLTTFITPLGRYCFDVLLFGISSGSGKFQKCMSQILKGLNGVECNIDDVLDHGATQEEHDRRLEAVLQRLSNANVTLNADKCVQLRVHSSFCRPLKYCRCRIQPL